MKMMTNKPVLAFDGSSEQGFSLIGTLKSYRHPQRRISAVEHLVEVIGLTIDGRDLRFLMDTLRFFSEHRRRDVAAAPKAA